MRKQRPAFQIAFLLTMLPLLLGAQTLAEYDFSDCTAADQVGLNDLQVNGNPACRCGAADNALALDGNDDFLSAPASVNALVGGPFTLGFYFWIQNTGDNPVDLISYMKACDRDSMFNITYIPVTQEVSVEIAQVPGISLNLRGVVNADQCWHHLSFHSDGERFQLYLDGELADAGSRSGAIRFTPSGQLHISNSPCIGILNTRRWVGVIDEFFITDQVLTAAEVADRQVRPDQILNRDTTIFLGDDVQILTGGTCAATFSWSPVQGLSSAGDLEPVASPTQSTVYHLTVNHGTCVARDSFDLKVIDPDALTCERLFLPTAFTPNGDGVNDEYTISNAFIIETLESFEIYDKWGGKVFATTDKLRGWDGNFKGRTTNAGTFLYKVAYTCSGQAHFKTGSFTLIR